MYTDFHALSGLLKSELKSLDISVVFQQNEKESLKPPSSLLARLSDKNANKAPLKICFLPWKFKEIPVVARALKSRKNGFRIASSPCFSNTAKIASLESRSTLRMDISKRTTPLFDV